ncbi:hypothetical protein BDZ97DRAFT_1722685, partial [Flammula alnicola]
MPFVVGDFQPRPVSHERAESPPPTFHPNTQPFLGVELFVSGLRNGAPYAAEDHLNQIIRHLAANGQDLPDLTIVSPSNPGLDYVFVSLKDSQLRRNPRPDVLEMVRLIFDEQSDISARWRIAKAADKARQLSFVAEDKDKAVALKTRLENVFRIEGYKVQNSWVTDSGCITFCFLSSSVVENLLRRYPVIDNQPVLPRRSRYIQPVYGLEVAVNGVGDYPQAQHMIDEYIQRKYGEKFGDNVVRESRVVQDESVYCALLVNPEVTTQFLSDEFDLFKQIPHHNATAPKWHPEYLYSLNNQGIPTSLSAFKSAFKDDSPLMHSQLNLIRGQVELLARSLQAVIETHNDILRSMDQINQRIERTTAASFLIMTANNKLTAAQSETNSLRSEANTARLLLFTATSERAQQHISAHLERIDQQIEWSQNNVRQLSNQVDSLQATVLPSISFNAPETSASPQNPPGLSLASESTSPSVPDTVSPHGTKRARKDSTKDNTETSQVELSERQQDEQDERRVEESMQEVCCQSLLSPLSRPIHPPPSLSSFSKPRPVFVSLSSPLKPRPVFVSLFSSFNLHPVLVSLFFFFFFTHLAHATSVPFTFRTVAINANGLGDQMKIAAIADTTRTIKPHALVIGETKNTNKVSSRLSLSDYMFYESPGLPLGEHPSTRKRGKWGVIVGVRRGLFNVQLVPLPSILAGRAVALDLTIPTTDNRGFTHRLIGIYAPWNPGVGDSSDHDFWPAISQICLSAPFSWSLHGDFNATLSSAESSSPTYSINNARLLYSQFLRQTESIDLWGTLADCPLDQYFTFKSFDSNVSDHAQNILPVRTIIDPYSPRFRFPGKGEKEKLTKFSNLVDQQLHSDPINDTEIVDDASFKLVYDSLTRILLDAASNSFIRPDHSHSNQPPKPSNATIRLILREQRRVNRLIYFTRHLLKTHSPLLSVPIWAQPYLTAFCQSPEFTSDFSPKSFLAFLQSARCSLNKIRFAEERIERNAKQSRFASYQIRSLLAGSSAKRLFHNSFSSLPLALTTSPDSLHDDVVTGPDRIKTATREYFQALYKRTARPPQDKPWLQTPSVQQISARTAQQPFTWPQALDLPNLRALLKKGNSRPCPGPDGWEKWFVKLLSDSALKILLKLLNYIILNSHFPSCVKDTNLSTIHKHSSNTALSNYRGVACSNLVETWAARNNVPLYILQRDQKKGFDMLEPQGFYDAITAYNLPLSIVDLDRSAQENVP